MSNSKCQACPLAHNGINGRYCGLLDHYVEQDKKPRCENNNKKDNNQDDDEK